MLDKFWESIGTNLAEHWLEYIIGPAFLFWAGSFGLYAWQTGWLLFLQRIQALTLFQQGSWLILAFLVLVFSSVLMQALRFPILRLLEGYWHWPFNYLSLGIIILQEAQFQKKYDELRHLASQDKNELNAKQRDKLNTLEYWVHWQPVKAKDLLPTKLGNILRAREYSPERKYGLDAIICWPRLWPLLPENVRSDLTDARSALDRLTELWLWGFLSLIWVFWLPWTAIISILWMAISYGIACQAAMAYGELLEAAFDLHRFSLYDAMGFPRPKNTQEEKAFGSQLTEFLWRGTLPAPIIYQVKEK